VSTEILKNPQKLLSNPCWNPQTKQRWSSLRLHINNLVPLCLHLLSPALHAAFFSSWKIPLYLDLTTDEEYWSETIVGWTWFIMQILVRKIATGPLRLWIFSFSYLEYSVKKTKQFTIRLIKKSACQAWVLHWIYASS